MKGQNDLIMEIADIFAEHKKGIIGALLVLAVAGGVTLAGTAHQSGESQGESEEASAAAAEQQGEAEPTVEEPTAYVLADDTFSNIQVYEPTKPVYDRYTIAQRRERGLPLELPALIPYTGERVAYLTFDDGPDAKNTPAILDILKSYGVPATFYVLGSMAEANPDVLKRIFDEGHAIGNHSYDHDYRDLYPDPSRFLAQMQRTDDIIYSIVGARPLIIRAPGGSYGAFTDDYVRMVRENGYAEHDWNVVSQDATPANPDAQQQIYNIDSQTNGELKDNMALVLMHSTGAKNETVKALPGIIETLKSKGFRFGVVTPMTPKPW